MMIFINAILQIVLLQRLIYSYIIKQIKKKKLFALNKLKGYILRNTHTYIKEQFDIFVKKVEEKEGLK